MSESESYQEGNQKTIRSIVKTSDRKSGQRSVSFKGVDFELLQGDTGTVERSRKVGLFGMARLIKEKEGRELREVFGRLKDVTESVRRKYSKNNLNCLSTLFKLLSNKRLVNSISTIKSTILLQQSSSFLPQLSNSQSNPIFPRSASTSNKLLKRSNNGTEYYNTQSQRSLKQRPSFRSVDNKSVRSTDEVITKEDAQGMMVLSEQAKKALLEMQRFDRFIYVMESEKRLKVPIEQELKRLEKIKNHYKCMRDSYYDNQLTITCLYNHMKNMYQMNRDLGEIVKLKAEIEKLQRKIIDNNVKHNSILKELKVSNSNAKLAEDAAMLRQFIKTNNTLIGILKDGSSVDKTKNEIEALIKSTPQDRRELLCLIQGRISESGSGTSNNVGKIYYSEISKLIDNQNNSDKNIKNVEKLKKSFAKEIEKCTNQEEHHTYDMLVNVADRLTDLYQVGKASEESESVNAELKKVKLMNEANIGKIKELEARLSTLSEIESSIKSFQELIVTITTKIETEENYLGDVVKNKRILSGKKSSISKLFFDILSLFEIFNKGDKKKQLQSTESRIKELQQANRMLTQQLSSCKSNPQTLQLTKFMNLFSSNISTPELTKIIKYIQLNKKKLPSYQGLLLTISNLISSNIQNQKQKKILQSSNLEQSSQKRKQLSNIQQLFSNVVKILEQPSKNNSIQMISSKVRKLIDPQLKKSQQHSQIEYQFNLMCKQSLKSISLMSQLLQSSSNEAVLTKTKEQLQRSKRINDNEHNKVMRGKDDEIERLKEEIEIINIRFNQEYQKINGRNQDMVTEFEKMDMLKKQNEQLQRLVNQGKVDAQIMGVLKNESQELKIIKVEVGRLRNELIEVQRLKRENMDLVRLRQQNQSLKGQIQQLDKLKIQNQQHLKNSSLLKQSNLTLSTQVNQLQIELQSKNNSLNNSVSRGQLVQLEQQNQNLLRQVSELKININNLNNQLQQITLKSNKSNGDLINFNAQKQRSNNEILILRRQNDTLRQTNTNLSQQLDSLKLQSSQRANSLNVPRHNNHIQITTTTSETPNPNKQKYYQQLYHSSKDENQQLRYELAEIRSRENSTISRPSIISSMNLTGEVNFREQNARLQRNLDDCLEKVDRYEREKKGLMQQINGLSLNSERLLREIEGYKVQIKNYQQQQQHIHSVSPTQSQVISSPTNSGHRISSHLVIKADNSTLRVNELEKQITRLNGIIKNQEKQNSNPIYNSTTTQIISSQSPRNTNFNSVESITRQKLFLQSQNKRLINEVNIFVQKQKQSNDQSIRLNNELRRYQQHDSYNNANNYRKQYQQAEVKIRRLTDSHRQEVNILNESMRKLTVENSSMSMKVRSVQYVPSFEGKKEDLLKNEIENRKKAESYLEQKVRGLEANTANMNQFIKQLELRNTQTLREIERLRSQNIFLQKKANVGGITITKQQTRTHQFQDRFTEMVLEKTTNLEKIQTLQNILTSKDIKISKIMQMRQVVLRQTIFQVRKIQTDIRKINQVVRSDKLGMIAKNLDSLTGKYEIELLDAIKEKAQQTSFYMESSKKKRYSASSLRSSEFIQNTNIVLHNLLVFLTTQKWLQPYNNQLPHQSQYYFEQVQKFLIDLFERVFQSKNQILDKQAHQLLMLREKMQDLIDQQISEIEGGNSSFRDQSFDIGETKRKASIIALQHIFKLYLKTKSPQLLKQILSLLHIEDD